MSVQGIVYEGSPETVRDWCQRYAGPGRCDYSWQGTRGWHITIVTQNGHEILRDGDAVICVGNGQLAIVRKD